MLNIVSAREREEISIDKARRRLADERLLWRGHAWEHRMLDALAGLEADGGDQITALATWQAALSREPDASMAASIMGRMRKALARALAVDDPSAVDPVTALALVGTFPTLLPASDQGHRLVDGLAARLADAGLPAQAAGLLDERRARGGPPPTAPGLLDLARYRLAADEAGAALAALARIEARAERPDVQRRLTEAQALLASGRPGDALRPLDQDAGPETSDLRALALWRLGSWGRLREELASDAGGALEGERRLRLAIATARVGGDAPSPTDHVEPAANQTTQALLHAVAASSPAVGSARAVTDGLASRIGALRAGLETLRAER